MMNQKFHRLPSGEVVFPCGCRTTEYGPPLLKCGQPGLTIRHKENPATIAIYRDWQEMLPFTGEPTAWVVDVAIDDETWGWLHKDGTVVASMDTRDRATFASREAATAAADQLTGWDAVKVVSNARY